MRDQRVLLVELPRVMRDIIRDAIGAEGGISLVGETTGDVDLASLVQATRADVVVIGLADARLPDAAKRLLTRHPAVRVLGVVNDGRDAVMYELRAHGEPLGEISPRALAAALRSTRERFTVVAQD